MKDANFEYSVNTWPAKIHLRHDFADNKKVNLPTSQECNYIEGRNKGIYDADFEYGFKTPFNCRNQIQ